MGGRAWAVEAATPSCVVQGETEPSWSPPALQGPRTPPRGIPSPTLRATPATLGAAPSWLLCNYFSRSPGSSLSKTVNSLGLGPSTQGLKAGSWSAAR